MQQDVIWQAVLGEIELSVSHAIFVTWFKSSSLMKHADDTVVIGVTNIFVKQQLERKYAELITATLARNGIAAKHIEYKMISGRPDKNRAEQSPDQGERSAVIDARGAEAATGRVEKTQSQTQRTLGNGLSHSYRQGLNENYTLDNFVVGSSNDVAFAACQAIAGQPGTKYNPLFLHGGVGIGKTHLIQAVGNVLAARNPDAKVLYISTEQFVQEFVDALRFRKTPAFARHYRTADVLIVDDVQFIAGKEKIQEEFYHTFNSLHQANKQIILSSDRPAKDIPTLQDRLRSRFAGGMTIDMQVPDFETRCAIVQTKALGHNIELDHDVVEYLATNLNNNIRELEGALNQLLAYCEVRGLEPTLTIASGLLNISKTRPKHLSAKQIIERTARHFEISVEDIIGPKRDKDIVVHRHVHAAQRP
jgi:chromosomal replication initiator protein